MRESLSVFVAVGSLGGYAVHVGKLNAVSDAVCNLAVIAACAEEQVSITSCVHDLFRQYRLRSLL
jgi:hypothetical protein